MNSRSCNTCSGNTAATGAGPLAPPATRSLARLAGGVLACSVLCACTLPAAPTSDYLGFVQDAMAEAARAESDRTHDASAAVAAVADWRRQGPAGQAGQARTENGAGR